VPLKKPGDLFNSNKNAPKESSIDLNGNIPNIKEEFDKVEDLREQLNNVSSSLNNSLTEVVNKNLNFLSDEYAQQLDKFNNKIDKFKEEIVYKVNNLKKSNSDLKADIQIVEQRQNKINITVITEEVLSEVQDVLSGNLEENIRIVKEFKRVSKQKLKIIYLPMPKPKFIDGIRVPASYLNFYIANKVVLVPCFDDLNDEIVIKIFKKHFKNRKVIPINCSTLVWGLGTIHCMTQQEPN